MFFAGAESARFRSDPRFPVPGPPPCRCASCGPLRAVCMYMKSSFKRDAAPARQLLPARRLLSARGPPLPTACCLLSAVCRPLCLPPVVCPAGCPRLPRFAWRAALSGISGIAAPALFPARFLLFLPLSCCSQLSRCSRPLPGRGRPLVTAQPLSGCAADGIYCLPLFRGVSRFPSGCWAWAQP